MTFGLFEMPWWGVLIATLTFTHLTIVSVTVYLHRNQAHRALSLNPGVAWMFRFWLWLTTGMNTKEWVAVHRKHHAFVETANDPHSPQVVGIKTVLLRGTELYREAAKDQQMLVDYGHGTPNDWWERKVFLPWDKTGIVIMLAANLILFGPIGLTVWAIQMIWIPLFAAGIINGVGHWGGYRNFETADSARNISPWGILIGGEELHNNHHAFASSARFSNKTWEFDVGWLYIRLLAWLKLAQVKKLSPITRIEPPKGEVDVETLTTLLGAQWHVLADYGKHVLHRVHREELNRAAEDVRSRLQRLKPLLFRNEQLLDDAQRSMLENVFAETSALGLVYEFRQGLQSIFQQRTASHESLLQQLQGWCRNAEQSGVAALEEFAAGISGYVLKQERYARI